MITVLKELGYDFRFNELTISEDIYDGRHTDGLSFPYFFKISKLLSLDTMPLTEIIQKDDPSFTWIHCMHTHVPYNKGKWLLPDKMEEMIKDGSLGAENLAEFYDEGVGIWDKKWTEFIEYIDSLDRDDILVIMLSDHGEMLLENYGGHTRYWHNYDFYPEMIYVPVVWYYKGCENRRIPNWSVRHIDIFPELMKKLDMEIPSEINGVPYSGEMTSNIIYAAYDYGVAAEFNNIIYAPLDARPLTSVIPVKEIDGGLVRKLWKDKDLLKVYTDRANYFRRINEIYIEGGDVDSLRSDFMIKILMRVLRKFKQLPLWDGIPKRVPIRSWKDI